MARESVIDPSHIPTGPLVSPTSLLRSRRASLTFALMVFLTSAIQVLATPLMAVIDGKTQWGLGISEPVIVTLLVLGCAAQALALTLSDRWPKLTVVLVTAIYLALALGLAVPSWLIGMYLVIALAMFLLATKCSPTTSVLWAIAVPAISVGLLLWWILGIGTPPQLAVTFIFAEATRLAVLVIGGTALGIWWAVQARRIATAREAAELAEHEHSARVAAAEERERARIAQELHDVAGQHLAGLVTLSDAALALAPTQPDRALDLVREVRNEGRFAAAGLAGALSDLRAVSGERMEVTRTLQRTPELIDFWTRRGMRIRLAVTGSLDDLPAVVSTTAYAALQEGMTNAAKHSPGAPVAVSIAVTMRRLDVSVENDEARPQAQPVPGLDLGWGVAGIRDRVELLGGTVAAGPGDTAGWRLAFHIPIT